MKKKSVALALSLALGFASVQGCIGSFSLTGKLYQFNKGLGNKWVQEIVFLAMVIIPLYGLTLLADGLIFNSIQFWTGSNPIGMEPGEKEVQYVKGDGKLYRVEATQNRFHIVQLEGPNAGGSADLIYNPETSTWLAGNGREIRRTVQFMDNSTKAKVFKPDGSAVMVETDSTQDEIYRSLGVVR